MDNKIEKALEENEQLLWSGRPTGFQLMDKTNKKSILVKAVTSVAVTMAVIVAYFMMVEKTGADVKPVVILVVVLVGILAALSRVSEVFKLRKHVSYAVTDRRILLVREDVESASYSDIPAARFALDEDGNCTLLCGADALASKPSEWRSRNITGIQRSNERGDKVRSLVLYAIPHREQLMQILPQYMNVEL